MKAFKPASEPKPGDIYETNQAPHRSAFPQAHARSVCQNAKRRRCRRFGKRNGACRPARRGGGKYYTDLIIYQNRAAYFELQKRFAEKYAQTAKEILRPAIEKLLALPFLAEKSKSVRQSAVSYFTLKALMEVYFSRERKIFTDTPYEDYPNRPGDGKRYAMGFVMEEVHDHIHARYSVDGPTGDNHCHRKWTNTTV